MKRRFAYQVVVAMVALVSSCGGDDEYVSVGEGLDRALPGVDPMDGSTSDGDGDGDGDGDMDGALNGDGSADMDGSFLDNLELPDGSIVLGDGAIQLPDGEIIDEETAEMRYGTETDVSTCEISELDSITVPVSFGDDSGFSLTAGPSSGFAAAVNIKTSGGCTNNVGVAVMPSMGALPDPTAILPDCKVVRDVALLGVPGGYQMAWIDNATNDTAELQRVQLDTQLKPMGAFARTTVTHSAQDLEVRPVLALIAGRPLLAWITRNAETQKQSVTAQLLEGDDTEAFEIVAPDAGFDPQSLAVSRMSTEGRAAVAWVGPQASPGVWLQPLDETGHPDGGPLKLTERVGASSSVDLAERIDGGGAVYSIVIDTLPQVRFQRLDLKGMPRGDERALIAPPQRAQDASIAGIGGGYAIAYRALAGEGQDGTQIRLMFISKEGNVSRDDQGRVISFLIAESSMTTGRTQIEVSNDGVLLIGWLDQASDGSGNVLRIARRSLTCAF